MSKKIEFNYNGKDYVLEYNRQAVAFIEEQGFIVSELAKKPMLMLPMAFSGLFYKNHKNIRQSEIDEIFDKFSNKSSLLSTIADMLSETYNTLQDDEKENKEGNIDWEIV